MLFKVVFAVVFVCINADLNTVVLNAHNYYRDIHGVPHLTLNSTICKYAQEWANDLARRNVMEHRSPNLYGENIYTTSAVTVNGTAAIQLFYDEIKYYNFTNPGWVYAAGHFTQVVWKNSKQIGVGVARGSTRTYLVVNYSPPGNYLNQFAANVLPPKK